MSKAENIKNPGKKYRLREKEINDIKRGNRIPLQKIVISKKVKAKRRSSEKKIVEQMKREDSTN
jgi:Na+-transporting NADH:ubiquinone oxidoreductase subunit NqrA